MRSILSCVLLLLLGAPLVAQPDSIPADSARGRSLLLLPIIFRTPETGFGAGAAGAYYHRGGAGPRPSSALASITVTEKGHRSVSMAPDIYHHEGRWNTRAELAAMKNLESFYGIGPDVTDEMEEQYTTRVIGLSLDTRHEVLPGRWLGARAFLRDEAMLETADTGMLQLGRIPGSRGGRIVGIGAAALFDSRDNIFSAATGSYAELRATLSHPAFGSEYRYTMSSFDLRHFSRLNRHLVIGHRAFAHFGAGSIPFSQLPRLGGPMRGYLETRLRDDALLMIQSELRFPIWWRFGGVAFAAIGDIAPDFAHLPPPRKLERAAGAGLRFRVNPAGANIRIDWAFSREGGGMYLAFGEAF